MEFRQAVINQNWSNEEKIDLLRMMVRIRRYEQRTLYCYNRGYMGGWLILSIGQETIAAGIRSLLGPLDHTISGCRGMGHAIAAGIGMGPCMAELQGKTNGCSGGMGVLCSGSQPLGVPCSGR